MKKLGVHIISFSASGRCRARFNAVQTSCSWPQFLTRTKTSWNHLCSGAAMRGAQRVRGPVCEELRRLFAQNRAGLERAARPTMAQLRNMEGPAFTRAAESLTHPPAAVTTSIGMTDQSRRGPTCGRARVKRLPTMAHDPQNRLLLP